MHEHHTPEITESSITFDDAGRSARALAERYRAFGFNIVPLGDDKRPVITGLSSNGKPLHFSWEAWATKPQAPHWKELRKNQWWADVRGVGLICGPVSNNLALIDFDDCAPSSHFWHAIGLDDDYPWAYPTPGNGWHVWVMVDGDLPIDKGKLDNPGRNGGKVELRWIGHYGAAPGSLHPNGGYQWRSEPAAAPATVSAITVIESYWTDAIPKTETAPKPGKSARKQRDGATPFGAKALADELAAVHGAANGGRNDQLNRSAFALGQLVAGGELDANAVEAALLDAALAIGLGEGEARATIESGMTRGAAEPRSAPKRDAAQQLVDIHRGEAEADADEKLSEQIKEDLKIWEYEFSLNTADDRLWCAGRPWHDGDEATLMMKARDAGYGGKDKPSLAALKDTRLMLAYQRAFHPLTDYLTALQWDGADHITELAKHITTTDEPVMNSDSDVSEWEAIVLRRWLIAAAGKILSGGITQSPMLVLSGNQSIGKSTFARWLCPLPKAFTEGTFDPDSNDHLRMMTKSMIWEISELDSVTRRRDVAALKSALTLAEVTSRAPYAHFDTTKPATVSFIGTCNRAGGILNDVSGTRRFLVMNVTKIDYTYRKLDINQLWAQAVAAYRANPEEALLTPAERERQNAINSEATIEFPFEGLLAKLCDFEPGNETPTAELVRAIQLSGNTWHEGQHAALAATLTHLGCERKTIKDNDGKRVRAWSGIKLSGDARAMLDGDTMRIFRVGQG